MAEISSTGDQMLTVLETVETRFWPAAVIGRRDRALLLLGFAGALRRSELAALTVGDVAVADGDLIVRIRSSKTDQAAAGATIAYPRGHQVATCTACAVLDWARLVAAFDEEGRVGVLRVLQQDRTRGRGHQCGGRAHGQSCRTRFPRTGQGGAGRGLIRPSNV